MGFLPRRAAAPREGLEDDERHEAQRQQDSRDDARDEQLADRVVGERAVDDHVDARRDEDAEVAAKRAQQPILVCSRPPGSRPSQADRAAYMRSAMPLRSSSSPSSTN